MKHKVMVKISNHNNPIHLELDDTASPNTVNEFMKNLPFTVDLNVWGEEVYTSESPIVQTEENSKHLVELYDVAYWPTGKTICLFYGFTPIGKPEEITPASPVNVIGKIISPEKNILDDLNGKRATFLPS
ncbi:cyclophilin-like fold protein [Nitrosopumilus sp.]|uniref:cyclophilin-like fold protein n=1 Tax=Nitrosopumilus sp. TaxID=2024843 RepID=UPI002930012D|nr:cyclophilin-like fold protein [Nitrosopumilus sp.]